MRFDMIIARLSMGWYRESGEKRNVISGRIGKNYAPPLYKTDGVWYIGSRDHDRKERIAMKKGLALLLALVLAAGLIGCGSAAGEDSRLTLARKALPDEPELTLAGIANLGDVCLIWVTAGGGEEPLRCYPLEFQVTGENRYAFTAVLEAEMPIQDIYVCHREGLGDFVLVNNPDFAEVVVTTEDGEETSERAPHELPAAFMLLDGYYDYRFVDKNGNDMAG